MKKISLFLLAVSALFLTLSCTNEEPEQPAPTSLTAAEQGVYLNHVAVSALNMLTPEVYAPLAKAEADLEHFSADSLMKANSEMSAMILMSLMQMLVNDTTLIFDPYVFAGTYDIATDYGMTFQPGEKAVQVVYASPLQHYKLEVAFSQAAVVIPTFDQLAPLMQTIGMGGAHLYIKLPVQTQLTLSADNLPPIALEINLSADLHAGLEQFDATQDVIRIDAEISYLDFALTGFVELAEGKLDGEWVFSQMGNPVAGGDFLVSDLVFSNGLPVASGQGEMNVSMMNAVRCRITVPNALQVAVQAFQAMQESGCERTEASTGLLVAMMNLVSTGKVSYDTYEDQADLFFYSAELPQIGWMVLPGLIIDDCRYTLANIEELMTTEAVNALLMKVGGLFSNILLARTN